MFLFHRSVFVGLGQQLKFSLSAFEWAKTHYDVLGLTSKATHNDIKSAYYKLSMVYHPDKNKGSDSALQKFRDITEAYEVLGNFKLRKLYDKGLLHTAGPQFAAQAHAVKEEDDAQTKFYKSRMKRARAPTPSGRTPIYNFDEWSQAHYGTAFQRKAEAKQRYERKMARDQQILADAQLERLFLAMGLLFGIVLWVTTVINNDRDQIAKRVDNGNSANNSDSTKN